MKATLSFEKTTSSDVSIMVDALRASTTITLALDKFKKVIPCFTQKEAFELKDKYDCLLSGERNGKKLEGFDIGNSPSLMKNLKTSKDTLILTTTNGTRILENMSSKVLIGSLINAQAVALKSLELAKTHIDVVMAGVKGEFATEDYLAGGEILYWIKEFSDDCMISEYGQKAINDSRDYDLVKKEFINSKTAKRLIQLGYEDDVNISCLKNISNNVAIYSNKELHLYI